MLNVIDGSQDNLALVSFNLLVYELTAVAILNPQCPPPFTDPPQPAPAGISPPPHPSITHSIQGSHSGWCQSILAPAFIAFWIDGKVPKDLGSMEKSSKVTPTMAMKAGGNAMSSKRLKWRWWKWKHWHLITSSEQESKVPAFAPVFSLSCSSLLSQQWSCSNGLHKL